MSRIRAAMMCSAMLGGLLTGVVEPAGAGHAEPADEPQAADGTVGAAAVAVTGMGNYCNLTWPDGRWSFAFISTGGNPCATLAKGAPSGYTVARRGLYSEFSKNAVVVRCQSDAKWVGLYRGNGNGPLQAAYDAAVEANKRHCVFTAAPSRMGVFVAPFNLAAAYTHATGFDFARPPYGALDVAQFGQEGRTDAYNVNNQGEDKSATKWVDDHDALDIRLPRGTAIRAPADGLVIMARNFQTTCTGSDSTVQREVALSHVIEGENGYQERFVTYYAHLRSFNVTVGQSVTSGHVLGYSGNTGCSSAPHLHFTTIKTTNTASKRMFTITWGTGANHNDGAQFAVDPYGFTAPQGFDPWAWRAYPMGALSVNLWKTGASPNQGAWG